MSIFGRIYETIAGCPLIIICKIWFIAKKTNVKLILIVGGILEIAA